MFSFLGVRHLQCFLLFCMVSVAYAMRVNISVAIVVMSDKKEFNWNEKTKGIIFSSFFVGYVITQIPTGYMARKCGGKILLLIGLSICSVLTMLTPLCVLYGNWQMMVAVRIVQGLAQGVVFPASHTMISKWSPAHERGTLSAIAYSGTQFGSCVMLAGSGLIAASHMGWPGIFYISGGAGLVWATVFIVWGASTPSDCKQLSERERHIIEQTLGDGDTQFRRNSMNPPWTAFFSSRPFWALLIVHCTNNWGLWTLLTQMPNYIKNILHLEIKRNAMSSALPYFTMWILCFCFIGISLYLNNHRSISVAMSRRIFNCIGHGLPAFSLIALGYVDKPTVVIGLLTLTVGLNSAAYLGYQVNHIDLSPNFGGVLMGITNCVANFTGILAPMAVAFIVTNEKSLNQWRIIFFITAALYMFGNIVFITCGKFDVQHWNDPHDLATPATKPLSPSTPTSTPTHKPTTQE